MKILYSTRFCNPYKPHLLTPHDAICLVLSIELLQFYNSQVAKLLYALNRQCTSRVGLQSWPSAED
jgi:hypothetical protein